MAELISSHKITLEESDSYWRTSFLRQTLGSHLLGEEKEGSMEKKSLLALPPW